MRKIAVPANVDSKEWEQICALYPKIQNIDHLKRIVNEYKTYNIGFDVPGLFWEKDNELCCYVKFYDIIAKRIFTKEGLGYKSLITGCDYRYGPIVQRTYSIKEYDQDIKKYKWVKKEVHVPEYVEAIVSQHFIIDGHVIEDSHTSRAYYDEYVIQGKDNWYKKPVSMMEIRSKAKATRWSNNELCKIVTAEELGIDEEQDEEKVPIDSATGEILAPKTQISAQKNNIDDNKIDIQEEIFIIDDENIKLSDMCNLALKEMTAAFENLKTNPLFDSFVAWEKRNVSELTKWKKYLAAHNTVELEKTKKLFNDHRLKFKNKQTEMAQDNFVRKSA